VEVEEHEVLGPVLEAPDELAEHPQVGLDERGVLAEQREERSAGEHQQARGRDDLRGSGARPPVHERDLAEDRR
jgi:hypothetical protein